METEREISEVMRDESHGSAQADAGSSGYQVDGCVPAENRRAGPFGGLSPSEAAVRKHEKQRERKAEREAEAELDRLTVSQRVSVQLARQLGTSLIGEIIVALGQAAREGRVQSARELREWMKLAGLDEGDAPADLTDIEDMTPEQRAVLRARLLSGINPFLLTPWG